MKDIKYFLKRFGQNLFFFIVINGGAYAFLSLCNWSLNVGTWGFFSRFLMAIVLLVMTIASYSALKSVLQKIRNQTN